MTRLTRLTRLDVELAVIVAAILVVGMLWVGVLVWALLRVSA